MIFQLSCHDNTSLRTRTVLSPYLARKMSSSLSNRQSASMKSNASHGSISSSKSKKNMNDLYKFAADVDSDEELLAKRNDQPSSSVKFNFPQTVHSNFCLCSPTRRSCRRETVCISISSTRWQTRLLPELLGRIEFMKRLKHISLEC